LSSEKPYYQIVDKLQQLQRSIKAIRESCSDIDGLSKHLRQSEIELLYGIDTVKNEEDKEKQEKKSETTVIQRRST
jgi:hypothetical protein